MPLLLLLLGGAACAGPGTVHRARPLDAPLHSAARLWTDWFSPAAVGRDLASAADRAAGLAKEPRRLTQASATAGNILAAEPRRLRGLGDSGGELLGRELRRTPFLPSPTLQRALDPLSRLHNLAGVVRDPSHVLGLDRRILGEPDDLEHRTDPADDRPEASLGARIWRRIAP